MKKQKNLIVLLIFTILLSCNSDEDTNLESNLTTSVIKKATLYDDGETGGAKEFFYDTDNKLYKIEEPFRVTEIFYTNNDISSIIFTFQGTNSIQYTISNNNGTISLNSNAQTIEIDYTGEYIDALKVINLNINQTILEFEYTRNIDNNLISYEINAANGITTYNFLNFDDKNVSETYNIFNYNDFNTIFNLKSSRNNPLSAEYIFNTEAPLPFNFNFVYDENDNVIQQNQPGIQVDYELIEL